MPQSVLEAIKRGIWDFEPSQADTSEYDATGAMPGTQDKLQILADRVESGLPLWHPSDRTDYDEEIESA